MKSFERTPVAGTYRTSCCRAELQARKSRQLPLCPGCRKDARWALVVSDELPRALPARRRAVVPLDVGPES